MIVSGSGEIDLRLPVFASGKVPALIVTTTAGAKRLRKQRVPDFGRDPCNSSRRERDPGERHSRRRVSGAPRGKLILVEGGPRLLGDFYAARLVDEQFLTLAPQIAGRDDGDRRLSLVMGKAFAPGDPLWGALIDARRGSSHLFLRYSFRKSQHSERIGRV